MNQRPPIDKKDIINGLLKLFKEHRRWVLFFGTGTSCELDLSFGMGALQAQLGKELGEVPEWAHIDEALRAGRTLEQVRLHDRPLLVMTQKLETEAIEQLRQKCANVWILLAYPDPDGNCAPSRTRVYMPRCPEPVDLDGEQLWKCDVFTERILEG